MDLTQGRAVHELVEAQSPVARAQALARLDGGLKEKLNGMKNVLLALLAPVEVQLDYSEDELDEFVFPDELLDSLLNDLGRLLQSYAIGTLYKSGARIVLAGATNVGKSSLFNLLLKEERSIVSPSEARRAITLKRISSWREFDPALRHCRPQGERR